MGLGRDLKHSKGNRIIGETLPYKYIQYSIMGGGIMLAQII